MIKTITPQEFDFKKLRQCPNLTRSRGNQSTRQKFWYKDIVTAFDIETSYIRPLNQSLMYTWQWAFGKELCVIGRTWEEFKWFIGQIRRQISSEIKIVAYVHNLSYEYHFLRGLHTFIGGDVMALKPRRILKANYYNVEFRCSYIHSNMSLSQYLSKMQCDTQKLEMNYDISRYSWTDISDIKPYITHDVCGLVEAIEKEMEMEGDNLYTIPLTSTGYVRRDVKHAMRNVSKKWILEQQPDWDTYVLEREAFRGGNTVANRYFVGRDVTDIKCADRSSSYPEVLINFDYPITKFERPKDISVRRLTELIRHGYAVLARITIENVHLKNKYWGAPYISKSKCKNILNAKVYNGRVLSAESLTMTITDIDLKILLDEYEFDISNVDDMRYAKYGKLPKPLIDTIIDYYIQKNKLKSDKEKEILYNKFKNKINAIFGMTATCPVREEYTIIKNVIQKVLEQDRVKALDDYTRKAFLNYAWGVWTTALARRELEIAIKIIHYTPSAYFIYSDTDSVYYTGEIDLSSYNAEKVRLAKEHNSIGYDAEGTPHYLGVYEPDDKTPPGTIFKTLGSKKYVKYYNNSCHITISGVNKNTGGAVLDAHGGLSAFRAGFTFYNAGREITYNDGTYMYYPEYYNTDYLLTDKSNYDIFKEGKYITYNPRIMRITPNAAIKEGTYKVGSARIEGDCRDILKDIDKYIDNLLRYKEKKI